MAILPTDNHILFTNYDLITYFLNLASCSEHFISIKHRIWATFNINKKKSILTACMPLTYVCQKYFTCMCVLGFIWYNETFIACGFMKYENVFTHEYHIPLRRCPQRIWYSWVNTFSYFPHQHAINVYYYIMTVAIRTLAK